MTSIIVGSDESEPAAAAYRLACRLADATGAVIEVVEAASPTSAERSPDDMERFEEDTRARLRRWLAETATGRLPAGGARVDDVPGRHTEVFVAVTAIEDALAERVDTHAGRDCVVVVGSHPTEGVTRLGLGSLPHHLARRLSCPLLAVPATDDPAARTDVVVGVDGSDGSRLALDIGVAVAGALGGRVRAVHAIDDVYSSFTTRGYYGTKEEEARNQAAWTPDIVDFIERLDGAPDQVLAGVAAEYGAAMLIVGTKEQRTLGGNLLGSVADQLLHEPPCPVMVLPVAFIEQAQPDARPDPLGLTV